MAAQTKAVKKQEKDQKMTFSRYMRGVRSEFKRVVWPTKSQLVNYTIVVLVVSLIVSGLVYILDFILQHLLKLFVGA